MKKITLFALILGLAILVIACGPAGGAPPPSATPTNLPEPTPTSAEASAPADEPGEVQEIKIIADAYGYDPPRLTIKAGSQIRFIITNVDENDFHDLWNKRANIDIEVPPGETKTYDWVAPQAKDTYIAECTLHEGLTLAVVVE